MNNNYPNPWEFSNTDKEMFSPNQEYKIEFYNLNEIAMGAPIGGECHLLIHQKKVKLDNWAAGPIIWNKTNDKVAFPIWTKNRNQKIVIVNIKNFIITIYKKEFHVLHFYSFENDTIYAIDSPIHIPKKIVFDTNFEDIEKIKHLNL